MCVAVQLVISSIANAAGLMKPVNSGLPDLEIRKHHVGVTIEDGYITTSIVQAFHKPRQL
ncbi:MAG: Ca-activated chloride channel family protein [Granulosicoccus sp.]|jgi:Ca-activated chloride channel family protein